MTLLDGRLSTKADIPSSKGMTRLWRLHESDEAITEHTEGDDFCGNYHPCGHGE